MIEKPTRVRYVVLAFACVLSMITYMDRVCFGAVAPQLASELSLESVADLKWAFTAFSLAYAIFEIPSGWLGDLWGPKKTLFRIVLWWSACTALTGIVGWTIGTYMVAGLGTLVVLRFLFGAGEAGAYPNITRLLYNWFPSDQAGTAQSFVFMSGRVMGGLTPIIWTVLVLGTAWTPALVTWRVAFALFGLMGVLWCAVFAIYFCNVPGEHPGVNQTERDLIERGRPPESEGSSHSLPARAFLRSGNLWLLCGMYFCMVYGWAFHITYLPAYLQERFHVDPQSVIGSLYKGGPLWIGAIGCLIGGFLVDGMIRRSGNRRRSRRVVGVLAESLCAVAWIGAIFAPNVHLFFVAISFAAFCNDLTLGSAWATCQDIGQRHSAMTAACMNTVGTLGAAVAGWATGTIVEQTIAWRQASSMNVAEALSDIDKRDALLAGFDYAFVSYAAIYAVSAICWRFIDASKPIVDIRSISHS